MVDSVNCSKDGERSGEKLRGVQKAIFGNRQRKGVPNTNWALLLSKESHTQMSRDGESQTIGSYASRSGQEKSLRVGREHQVRTAERKKAGPRTQ